MPDPNFDSQPPDIDVRQLAYAVRLVLVAIVLGLSLYQALSAPLVEIIRQMGAGAG